MTPNSNGAFEILAGDSGHLPHPKRKRKSLLDEEPRGNSSDDLHPQYEPVEEKNVHELLKKDRKKKKIRAQVESSEILQQHHTANGISEDDLRLQYGPVEEGDHKNVHELLKDEKKDRKKKKIRAQVESPRANGISEDDLHPQHGPDEEGYHKEEKDRKKKKEIRAQVESLQQQHTANRISEDPPHGPVEEGDQKNVHEFHKDTGKMQQNEKKEIRVQVECPEILHQQHSISEEQSLFGAPDKRKSRKKKKRAEDAQVQRKKEKGAEDAQESLGQREDEKTNEKPNKRKGHQRFKDKAVAEGVSEPVNGQDRQKQSKKVSFNDNMDTHEQKILSTNEDNLEVDGQTAEEFIWGKRFTKEEDEILKEAVLNYIKMQGWNEVDGLNYVMNCRTYKEARGCWKVIRTCLPYRPQLSVRYRAHSLFEEGTHLGRWSFEEKDALKRLQEEYGNNWRKISTLLGRGRPNIKERWRTLKRPKASGVWTQSDLQKLCDLVHECLSRQAMFGITPKSNDHRNLRDNINWQKIADDIGTHGHGSCCGRWYNTLTSSMIASGEWANGDDQSMLLRLLESGACAEEEVEWDQLLDHRLGGTCMNRWQQMVKHLGESRTRPFLEKLQLLARRYAPQLLESCVEENSEIKPL